jgi:hypothetical protein
MVSEQLQTQPLFCMIEQLDIWLLLQSLYTASRGRLQQFVALQAVVAPYMAAGHHQY